MNQPQEIPTTSKYIDSPPNYDKFPFISVTESSSDCICGWNEIIPTLINAIADKSPKSTIVFETYPGIDHTEILKMLTRELQPDSCINTLDLFKPEKELNALLSPINFTSFPKQMSPTLIFSFSYFNLLTSSKIASLTESSLDFP